MQHIVVVQPKLLDHLMKPNHGKIVDSMGSVSIVIPVFNSAQTIEKLHRELVTALEAITDKFEIIMVDDCSVDDSWKSITAVQKDDHRVRGIRLSRNYGQHNALLCAIRAAQYETIVTMDDDLQNPVSEISKLINKLNEGYDVVYGSPDKQQHGILRNLASSITKFALQNIMGAETARSTSAFRAFKTNLRVGFQHYNSPHVLIDVLLTWTTSKFASVKVRHIKREVGESNYTVMKLVRHALNLLTGFTTLPLQIASMIGFAFMFFGIGILIWVVYSYFMYEASVPGFAFLASIISIFSGVQLFALGIFGEYLARIHFRTMNRPPYVISEQCRNSEEVGVSSSNACPL